MKGRGVADGWQREEEDSEGSSGGAMGERWERTVVLLWGRGRYSIAYLGPWLPNVLWEEKGVGWASPLPFLFPFFLAKQCLSIYYTVI